MRSVTNEQLATALAVNRILHQACYAKRLGRSREVGLSPVRTYQGNRYYTYGDGAREFLVVAEDEDVLYAPLLALELGTPAVADTTSLEIPIEEIEPEAVISGVQITYGDTAIVLPAEATRRSIAADVSDPETGFNLGSVARVEVTFSRFDRSFTASHDLPYFGKGDFLRSAGLDARSTADGSLYVFRDDQSEERLEELVELMESGQIPPRFVDVIARRPEDGRSVNTISVDGREFLTVDSGGFLHLVSAASGTLRRMSRAHALAVAQGLSLDAKAPRRGRRLPALLRPMEERVQRGAAAAAVAAVGFKHYERARLAFMAARTPTTPYQSYAEQVDHSHAEAGTVLIDGYNGKSISGSMLALARELSTRRPDSRIRIAAQDPRRWEAKLERYGIRARLVKSYSQEYYDSLRTSELILTDSTLPRSYIKTAGQTLINTWHGTPLKRMGRDIERSPLDLANVQRNFLLSDLVALNNRYAVERMTSAFMVDGQNFRVLPSPRVAMLLEAQSRQATLRAELGIGSDELVVLWMPTWRGSSASTVDVASNLELVTRMAGLRSQVGRPLRFFARTHQFLTGLLDLPDESIEGLPDEIDVYEFLSIVDVLVTDYSSIVFDFAVRNKPIILDVHDLDSYSSERGLYLDVNALPFTVTGNEGELVAALETAPMRVDHSDFNAQYNPHDSPMGAEHFIAGMASTDMRDSAAREDRVLIFPGSMKTNGITTSFMNLLSNLDDERDYEVFLPMASLSSQAKANASQVLDHGRTSIVSPRGTVVAPSERFAWSKYEHRLDLDDQELATVARVFRREARRLLGDRQYAHAIHFSGYDALPAGLLGSLDTRSHVFIHSNMGQELALRNNFNNQVLQWAYRQADSVAVVSEAVLDELVESGYLTAEVAPRARVVHNSIDQPTIMARSGRREDYLTADLSAILEDVRRLKFVNVGRFSPEKGQDRLVAAFEEVSRANPDRTLELFLIGGPGNARKKLHWMRDSSDFGERIHFFENINPMPILAKCDLFVQASHYEGFGMALLEAIALGVPVMSTRIPGPAKFLSSGYGYLVDDSTEGLVEGMQDFIDGRLPRLTGSLEEYNRQAMAEFQAMLE